MRTQVYNYVKTLDIGSFRTTEELPWSESGIPLYIKNLKTLYISNAQTETETLIAALDGLNIQNKTVTVQLFFACDAKKQPSNYEELMSQLLDINSIQDVERNWDRSVKQQVEYDTDKTITQVDYIFTKLT